MDLDLSGRRAFVTASSAGIGAAVVQQLAAEGCAVLVHGRDQERTAQVANQLAESGIDSSFVLGDLTDPEALTRVGDHAREWGVQILVNNVGPYAEHDWDSVRSSDWESAVVGNVMPATHLIQALTPSMREQGWGRVINVGSRAVTTPLPSMVEYSAVKAMLVNLTTSLAQHLAGYGITANTVSPGIIATDGLRDMLTVRANESGTSPEWPELESHAVAEFAANPTGRLGTPHDIASTVAFLASPLAGYINGIDLRVDGGITGTS
jgi:3-oxoacyl-[acyl-carrier protein] reductase